MSEESWIDDAIKAMEDGTSLPEGVIAHVSRATTQADWDALNPYSESTSCRDCGEYYESHWNEEAHKKSGPPKLVCPKCGSTNHGGTCSPAGADHLAMHDASYW